MVLPIPMRSLLKNLWKKALVPSWDWIKAHAGISVALGTTAVVLIANQTTVPDSILPPPPEGFYLNVQNDATSGAQLIVVCTNCNEDFNGRFNISPSDITHLILPDPDATYGYSLLHCGRTFEGRFDGEKDGVPLYLGECANSSSPQVAEDQTSNSNTESDTSETIASDCTDDFPPRLQPGDNAIVVIENLAGWPGIGDLEKGQTHNFGLGKVLSLAAGPICDNGFNWYLVEGMDVWVVGAGRDGYALAPYVETVDVAPECKFAETPEQIANCGLQQYSVKIEYLTPEICISSEGALVAEDTYREFVYLESGIWDAANYYGDNYPVSVSEIYTNAINVENRREGKSASGVEYFGITDHTFHFGLTGFTEYHNEVWLTINTNSPEIIRVCEIFKTFTLK